MQVDKCNETEIFLSRTGTHLFVYTGEKHFMLFLPSYSHHEETSLSQKMMTLRNDDMCSHKICIC